MRLRMWQTSFQREENSERHAKEAHRKIKNIRQTLANQIEN